MFFISCLVSTVNDNVVVSRFYDEHKMTGPNIEDSGIISAGACILPGITIGHGAMVGINAVVPRDVFNYDVVMGTPARVTRSMKPN